MTDRKSGDAIDISEACVLLEALHLPPRQFEFWWLSEVEKLSISERAKVLGVSYSSTRRHEQIAERRLRSKARLHARMRGHVYKDSRKGGLPGPMEAIPIIKQSALATMRIRKLLWDSMDCDGIGIEAVAEVLARPVEEVRKFMLGGSVVGLSETLIARVIGVELGFTLTRKPSG